MVGKRQMRMHTRIFTMCIPNRAPRTREKTQRGKRVDAHADAYLTRVRAGIHSAQACVYKRLGTYKCACVRGI